MTHSGQKLPLRPWMSDLSLPTVLHSVLGTTQRHHLTTVTVRTWGPEAVRRTKYRTEKIKRLKTKALKKKTPLEPNFWATDVTQKDDFLGVSDVTPGGFFFYYGSRRHRRWSPEVSDVTSRSPVPRWDQSKNQYFLQVKKEKKKTKSGIFPLLSRFHFFFRQIFLTHTCRNWFNAMKTS